MSGERPVPEGNLNTSCPSHHSQYLETGELSQLGVGVSRGGPPVPKGSRGDRDARLSTCAISNSGYQYQMSNSYLESGASDFDDSRSWSRSGYYETDPPPMDYPGFNGRGHQNRGDPYYGHGNEYEPPRRPPADPYYRVMGRGYGGPPYRHEQSEYCYPPEPPYRWNRQNTDYHSLPRQSSVKNEHLTSYLQEFRSRDPAGYKEWYRQYKEHKANPDRVPEPLVPGFPPQAGRQPQYTLTRYPQQRMDRRTSVRCGYPAPQNQLDERRERVPNQPPSDRGGPESENEYAPSEPGFTSRRRLTPKKFNSGHCIGVITQFGHLIRVSRGSCTVEIHHAQTLMKNRAESQKLDAFPGPLVRGRTHKDDVIKFCQKKIKSVQNQEFQTDKENLILLWNLLILLIKQHGSLLASDISELLLKNKTRLEVGVDGESNNAEAEGDDGDRDLRVSTTIASSTPNDPNITQGFCEPLLFGHKTNALDFAMEKGLWGHAFFLASKMDGREYGQVMARFANGVAYNHPLQTLYQIMSGRVPSCVNGCIDDAFGDWRPHLAMIISNAGSRPDVEKTAITMLGDTLRNKNLVYGAQFCHLMAHSTFAEDSKLGPLLGLSPDRSNVIEATQMTEIYEFAMSLGDAHFHLGSTFLRAKFDYVKILINFGFTFQGFSYCEVIAEQLGSLGNKNERLRWGLLQVGERLKHLFNYSDWTQDLRNALTDAQATDNNNSGSSSRRGSYPPSGISSVDEGGSQVTEPDGALIQESVVENGFGPVSCDPKVFNPNQMGNVGYDQREQLPNPNPSSGAYESNQQLMLPTNAQVQSNAEFESNQVQQPSWHNPAPVNQEISSWDTSGTSSYTNLQHQQQPSGTESYSNLQQLIPKEEDRNPEIFKPQQNLYGDPTVGLHKGYENNDDLNYLPPSGHGSHSAPPSAIVNGCPGMDTTGFQPYLSCTQPPVPGIQRQPPKTKNQDQQDGRKKLKANTTNTNEGGLFGWLGLRPKNQMILPDDKEPPIVWDEAKKKWVNSNASGEDDDTSGPPPPPKDSELNAPLQQQHQMGDDNPPPQQLDRMHHGQPTSVIDGPPSSKPQFNEPIPVYHKENWENPIPSMPVGPAPSSLNLDQPPPLQPTFAHQSRNPQQYHQQPQLPLPTFSMNKYKLPKGGGGMRGKYVDVLKASGNSGGQHPMGMAPPTMMAPMVWNCPSPMFVPTPSTESEEVE